MQMEMFKREIEELVNPAHALVKLGRLIDWSVFEEKLGAKPKTSSAGVSPLTTPVSNFIVFIRLLKID